MTTMLRRLSGVVKVVSTAGGGASLACPTYTLPPMWTIGIILSLDQDPSASLLPRTHTL